MTAKTNFNPEPTWRTIVRLLRWNKPAGRLILMIPALWAVFLAAHSLEDGGMPPLPLIGVIVLGTLATSAAGCVINDLWDRNIDPNVERTRNRPLASRSLTVRTGIVVMLVAFACAAGLAFYLNPLSFGLCVVAVPFIVLYPLAKRVFPIPQLILSLNWGFAVLISWTAAAHSLSWSAWLLWAAVMCWTMGFDTVYAMADREDDKKLGVNSSALFFGDRAADAVGIFFAGTAIFLELTAIVVKLNIIFPVVLAIAITFWALQYMDLKPKRPHPSTYGRIFRQNVWIGFLILGGIILGTL